MKNFFKKLHIMSNNNQPEDNGEGSNSSKGNHNKFVDGSSPDRIVHSRTHHGHHHHDHSKPFSGLSGWLNSVGNRNNSANLPGPSSSSNMAAGTELAEPVATVSGGNSCVGLVDVRDSESNNNSRDPDVEEEYQIQLALELSAREDPEAVQIEAVKQISLGSCAVDNTPAEVVAFRYWNYNVLGYDDKILDGFYDVYGILNESNSERMPSLIDLQGTPVLDSVTWEAVLVNKAADSNLLRLEQIVLEMAVKSRSDSLVYVDKDLVRKLGGFVANYMGGPVGNPETMLREWKNLTFNLKATIGSLVLPLGSLKVGLARHRALLFKVLADSVNIPCRLVKGEQYTGSSDVAMNFVKLNDGREYIVDLMSDPGTLIPSDAAGSQAVYHGPFFYSRPMSRDNDSSHAASSSSWVSISFEDHSEFGIKNSRSEKEELPPRPKQHGLSEIERESKMPSDDSKKRSDAEKGLGREFTEKPGYPYAHARSPSWTEGVSSPAVRKKKVKDVSKYMIDAAKENPRLAQKLHDVLLESGVMAPPDLFTEAYPEQLNVTMPEANNTQQDEARESKGQDNVPSAPPPPSCFLPPLPHHRAPNKPEQSEISPVVKYPKNVPVAAAAAAAAAVVASSMVVAASKTSSSDGNLELPVAAVTAAAVVATTAAVSKQYEQGLRSSSDGDATDSGGYEQRGGSGGYDRDRDHEAAGTATEGERTSDKSGGNESAKSDSIESVADCEIPWEEIAVGERIGLGSYGEVYRGEWHGTEVAVKRFLDQDITGESLAEFMKEVQIMKKLRHPNVVLFMGAVTRAPNLSIVTEFLPRGSLYRLLHRPNNQLDERRRLRMALDAARGMNYLHNSTPVIVHRDLKSPNLLVDKNWVVKVCDFGLSKIKHSTFLSSRSTAGTAEWMAPEVLRNELSDEKCDVYSFGVILWELSTMQQPWGGMNPMQVVGAVGFQHRRLEIPDNMDPTVADIIRQCWQTDPKLRPTFAEIMATLKPLQRPITSPQGQRGRERAQPSRIAD